MSLRVHSGSFLKQSIEPQGPRKGQDSKTDENEEGDTESKRQMQEQTEGGRKGPAGPRGPEDRQSGHARAPDGRGESATAAWVRPSFL